MIKIFSSLLHSLIPKASILVSVWLIPNLLYAQKNASEKTQQVSAVQSIDLESSKVKDSLSNEKTKAEIALLNKNVGAPDNILPLIVAGVGALLSIISGIISGTLAARWQAKLEKDKWMRQRADSFESELRNTVKELTISIAEAFHSMCWVCWLAKYGPERLSIKNIKAYDKEMHILLPKIEGTHSVIAGMDYQVYQKIRPLVKNVIKLDAQIGSAGLTFIENQPYTALALAKFHDESVSSEKSVSDIIAEAIQHYSVKSNNTEK